MIARRTLLVAAIVLASPSVLVAAPLGSRALIEDFYRRGMRRRPVRAPEIGPRAAILSRALAALWAKADARTPQGSVGPLSFDPTTNAQGADVKSYSVSVEHEDKGRASVLARVVLDNWSGSPPDGEPIAYDLIRENAAWKIDDIRGRAGDTAWSLRDLIARHLRG